jgi:nucleoside-diphosphate-sugar epimerase
MKCLITGAAGFTGRHFTEAANGAGISCVPLQANLLHRESLFHEIELIKPDYVVHLAAISFVGHGSVHDIYQVNLIGTLNLLEAISALGSPPRKILIASSANVYGNTLQDPIVESTPPDPVNHYAASKLAMEKLVSFWFDKLPIVLVRPFNYTGVGQSELFLLPKIVGHFRRKLPFVELGNTDVERDFSDVRVVTDAYKRLLVSDQKSQIFNVSSGKAHSLGWAISVLSEISGHQLEVRINPAFVRPNDIKRLRGSARKLESVIGPLQRISLEETLQWMYSSADSEWV